MFEHLWLSLSLTGIKDFGKATWRNKDYYKMEYLIIIYTFGQFYLKWRVISSGFINTTKYTNVQLDQPPLALPVVGNIKDQR